MAIESRSKLNQFLSICYPGMVLFSGWLNKMGYSDQLLHQYRKSGWIKAISKGVFVRANDNPNIFGVISSLENQMQKNIYVGAHSALELSGFSHFIPMGEKPILMVGHGVNEKIPLWLRRSDYGYKLMFFSTSTFLKPQLSEVKQDGHKLAIATPEQAILECLLLAPQYYNLLDIYLIMEQLSTLRPEIIQGLLEGTSNYKVKRLFLYMAKKAGHNWFSRINLEKVNIGKGKQKLVSGGVYLPDYMITIPKELKDYA